MCDYCANGVWIDGASTDWEDVCEEFNIDHNPNIEQELDDWQNQYENMMLLDDNLNTKELKELKEFNEKGFSLFVKIKEALKGKNIKIEYFNEKDQLRYTNPKVLFDNI